MKHLRIDDVDEETVLREALVRHRDADDLLAGEVVVAEALLARLASAPVARHSVRNEFRGTSHGTVVMAGDVVGGVNM